MPLESFSHLVTMMMRAKVALDRIASFMEDSNTTDKYSQLSKSRGLNSPYIGFEHASFTWGASKNSGKFSLTNISVDFPVGRLSVVFGPTGSGKTSLLMALLGEMTLLEGSVFLPGVADNRKPQVDPETGYTEQVAYCAQQAWLLNDSIRNNILFGQPMDENRYRQVITACALRRDFKIFEHSDLTEVGEKGIALSGGQKQRISLARAVYSRAKHLLLDDCLSAIDAHSALWVYQKCITGPLMAGRTCILVSHNVSLSVPGSDFVVAIDDGKIQFQGTPTECYEQKILASTIKSEESLDSASSDSVQAAALHEEALKDLDESPFILKHLSEVPENFEMQQNGQIKSNTYMTYFKYMGGTRFWTCIFLACIFQQIAEVSKNWWIGHWSDVTAEVETATTNHGPLFYLSIYLLISVIFLAGTYGRDIICYLGSVTVSQTMFSDLLTSVLYATPRFFDTTPVGRILNRFGKDVETVDREVISSFINVELYVAELTTIIFVICMIIPQFVFVAIIISVGLFYVAKLYSRVSLDLRRMQSVTLSPIYQHFGETLAGLSTIRAYGREAEFAHQNMSILDMNTRPFMLLWACSRWMNYYSQALGGLVAAATSFFLILQSDSIDPSFAGLCLTYSMTFSESMASFVLLWTMSEMNMNSVERVIEFIDTVQEAPAVIEDAKPPPGWPHEGSIEIHNLSLRYASDLPKVIDDISFDIRPGWNVGIVGRTGAGKSTIASAFFRFLEAEEGRIMIDGVNIKGLGLRDLREALTIIPQGKFVLVKDVENMLTKI